MSNINAEESNKKLSSILSSLFKTIKIDQQWNLFKKKPLTIFVFFLFFMFISVATSYWYLKTQFDEKIITTYLNQYFEKNFPEYQINLSSLDLKLRSKFFYSANKISIKPRSNKLHLFDEINLRHVIFKLPLFFFMGKQELEIIAEQTIIKGLDSNEWKKNNFALLNAKNTNQDFYAPSFLIANKVNLLLKNISIINAPLNNKTDAQIAEKQNTKHIPLVSTIKQILIKNLGIHKKSALEIDFDMNLIFPGFDEVSTLNILGIGDIDLTSFLFPNTTPSFHIFFEVKGIDQNTPLLLKGAQLNIYPINEDSPNASSNSLASKSSSYLDLIWNFKSSSLQFTATSQMSAHFFELENIKAKLQLQDWVRSFSQEFKRMDFIQYLFERDLISPNWDWEGSIAYNSINDTWMPQLKGKTNPKNGDNINWNIDYKIENAESNPNQASNGFTFHHFYYGDSFTGKSLLIKCTQILCPMKSLRELSYDLNKINLTTSLKSLSDFQSYLVQWQQQLLNPINSTPHDHSSSNENIILNFSMDDVRWNDFEFSWKNSFLLKEHTMSSNNLQLIMQDKVIARGKLTQNIQEEDDQKIFPQLNGLFKLQEFPAAFLAKFFTISNMELNGETSGDLTYSLADQHVIDFSLNFHNGSLKWKNYPELYLQKTFSSIEEENINYPLQWNDDFNFLKMVGTWSNTKNIFNLEWKSPHLPLKKIILTQDAPDLPWKNKIYLSPLGPKTKTFLNNKFSQDFIEFYFKNLSEEKFELVNK